MSRVQQRRASAARPANRRVILYATIAVVILAVVIAVAYSSRIPTASTVAVGNAKIAVGETAPEFALSTTQGPFDLATIKKPVFLEVFATWCPHCQRETAIINSLYARYGKDVAFVSVNGDAKAIDSVTPESQEDVVQFGQHFNVKYPLAYDSELTVAKSYLQNGFPTMIVINKQRKIAAIFDGEKDENALAEKIKAVL